MSIWAYAIHWAMFKVHFESTAWCIVTHKLSCSTEVKTCLRKVDHDGGPEHEMRTVTRYLEIHCIWFHVPLKKKKSWSFVVICGLGCGLLCLLCLLSAHTPGWILPNCATLRADYDPSTRAELEFDDTIWYSMDIQYMVHWHTWYG